MLVFLPAAAGARIVAADFGRGGFHRRGALADRAREKPAAIHAAELGLFLHRVLAVLVDEERREFDKRVIGIGAGFVRVDREARPAGGVHVAGLGFVGCAGRWAVGAVQVGPVVRDVRRETRAHQLLRSKYAGEYPDNVTVSELPNFNNTGKEAYKMIEKTGVYVLRALAIHIGLDEFYFDKYITDGNSILRPIHYPPITDEPKDGAVRAAAHGDINLITLLMGAQGKGLQVQNHDGQWIDAIAEPDEMVINVGDMLARHTNNKLKSTIHQVVNPPRELWGTSRFSIPFRQLWLATNTRGYSLVGAAQLATSAAGRAARVVGTGGLPPDYPTELADVDARYLQTCLLHLA